MWKKAKPIEGVTAGSVRYSITAMFNSLISSMQLVGLKVVLYAKEQERKTGVKAPKVLVRWRACHGSVASRIISCVGSLYLMSLRSLRSASEEMRKGARTKGWRNEIGVTWSSTRGRGHRLNSSDLPPCVPRRIFITR